VPPLLKSSLPNRHFVLAHACSRFVVIPEGKIKYWLGYQLVPEGLVVTPAAVEKGKELRMGRRWIGLVKDNRMGNMRHPSF
jgi:hypothetical protein